MKLSELAGAFHNGEDSTANGQYFDHSARTDSTSLDHRVPPCFFFLIVFNYALMARTMCFQFQKHELICQEDELLRLHLLAVLRLLLVSFVDLNSLGLVSKLYGLNPILILLKLLNGNRISIT